MAFFGRGRKQDLILLAKELGLSVTEDLTVVQIKKDITSSIDYDEELIKNMLTTIIEDRQKNEEFDRIARDQAYDLERLRLQAAANRIENQNPSVAETDLYKPKYELKSLLPSFKLDDDISLFLNLFERQVKFLKIPEDRWVTYLVGVFPTEIVKLIAREPDEKAENYSYIKDLLLKRFKLSADKFRQLFSSHKKTPEYTWTDFYFELRNYFEHWLTELRVDSFEKLQNLIITDQIKKRCPPDFKEHFLDEWGIIATPTELVEKLDAYENLRTSSAKGEGGKKQMYEKLREKPIQATQPMVFKSRKFSKGSKQESSEMQSSVYCYGCGTPNVIKSKCPTCSTVQKSSSRYSMFHLNSITTSTQTAVLEVQINGLIGTACADTAATHSMAGEVLYTLLQEQGVKFNSKVLTVTLADGSSQETEVLYSKVRIHIKGRTFPLVLNVLPEAKGNHTLLGIDFLKTSGIVLNIKDQTWCFSNQPKKIYQFVEEAQVQSCIVDEEATLAKPSVLRPGEGENLNKEQVDKLNTLLSQYANVFEPNKDPTPVLEHYINTGNHPPVSVTPNGLEVDSEKISAILKIPPPVNVKQLKSFLQTASWYRKFIPNFAKISQPLSNLTKKNMSWTWGKTEKEAFDSLKQCLVSPPVLKQADVTKPFIIRTDASSYAIGAVLSQGEDYDEHPIEFASRLLLPAERNYSTTEREALAVVWALEKFRGYIEGAAITVVTDHQPLKWLLKLKSPTGRLARWALQIQSFNLKIEYLQGKSNVVADLLSRPFCNHSEENCEICTIRVDLPTRSPNEVRTEQLKDENLKKIIESFEKVEKDEDCANFCDRGYLMNQGILYRYSPDSDSEEAQLVVPEHERERVLKEFHDAPEAGHYGVEGTFNRISSRYYWVGMRRFIAEYIKNCIDCCRYKASNQKPSGLLQTPIHSQRFETIAIDLFGPLPETKDKKKWVFIVEDCSTKWVELFALTNATAKECATTLIEEIFTRYGIPRRVISDNGTQFVSAVMQQVCFLMDIQQCLTPVYHPQANPVERKNRDLKPRIAILVGSNHNTWDQKLPAIRFALNTARCESTAHTPAYLQFGRELRTIDDISHDFRSIVDNDNFIPEITPYLKKFATVMKQVRENVERCQDRHKKYADRNRKPAPKFKPGDFVWVTLHPISQANKGKTAKFMPRRDGPYIIHSQRSPTSYTLAAKSDPCSPIGNYHSSALRPCSMSATEPVAPIRKRGRPKHPPESQRSSTKREPDKDGNIPNVRRPTLAARQEHSTRATSRTRTWSGRLRGRL